MSGSAEQFGKYILLEKLAAGGMAEVYLALSTGAGGVSKFLAIKRILPQYSENQEFIEMFKEEAKIAVNLNHSNVTSIYDFGVERSQFFLVMEYVEGRNLRQTINELKKSNIQITIENAVYVAKETAAGLDHAHRCIDGTTGRPLNITHRDMSPQNVMVSFEGEVKVIDFGIAKAETQMDSTRAGTLKGKFGYMSPEQADGQTIDLRTDIFSLGIVLWEMLANDRLFAAQNEAAILRKIRECHIPSIRKINPSVSPELERIINKALARDKSLRYQTAAAMHRDLSRYLNTEFPEFSPQDFSVFVKNLFAQYYTETKKRLVDYARMKAELVEATQVTKTQTRTNNSKTGRDDDKEYPTGIRSTNPDAKINLNQLKRSQLPSLDGHRSGVPTIDGLPPARSSSVSRSLGQGTSATRVTKSSRSISSRTQSSSTRKSITRAAFEDETDDFGTWLLRALIIICIIGGGYLYLNKNKGDGEAKMNSTGKLSQKVDQSSKVEYITVIDSTPGAAKIFIDGKDIGAYTPHRATIEGHKEFHLALKKDGYVTYEAVKKLAENATTIRATLQPLPRSAYININVVNGGAKPIVEVNGMRLVERMPVQNYAIPANTRVSVKAYNPFSKLQAEETVLLDAQQRKTVELVLKAKPRKPSNNSVPKPKNKR